MDRQETLHVLLSTWIHEVNLYTFIVMTSGYINHVIPLGTYFQYLYYTYVLYYNDIPFVVYIIHKTTFNDYDSSSVMSSSEGISS